MDRATKKELIKKKTRDYRTSLISRAESIHVSNVDSRATFDNMFEKNEESEDSFKTDSDCESVESQKTEEIIEYYSEEEPEEEEEEEEPIDESLPEEEKAWIR